MSVLVRRAVDRDAEAIAALHIRSWQRAYRNQLPDEFLDHLSDELENRTGFWRSHISTTNGGRHEIWTAEIESRINGFSALGPARDVDAAGELYAIYVEPESWHQGVGRTLLAHSSERLAALGYSTAILWVLESNARAHRFYERAGWRADGGAKIESLPDGTTLREVRYRILFSPERKNEA